MTLNNAFKTAQLFILCILAVFSESAFTTEALQNDSQQSEKQSTHSPQVAILQYHHVDKSTPEVTSVSPETFEKHMKYISEHHTVVPLKDAIEAIRSNTSLPDKAIAITFDDGFKNIYENAHPVLKRYNFPYTIFINPENISRSPSELSWEQIEEMEDIADFANHTMDHIHLLEKKAGESESQWLERVMANINQAESILSKKLGYSLKYLAYPFGEFNQSLQNALTKEGYVSFGQQSGVVSQHSDFSALPRFPASGSYANLDTLSVKMRALSMPVQAFSPASNQQALNKEISEFTLQLKEHSDDVNVAQLACFFKGERIEAKFEGKVAKIEVDHRFSPGRIRINCTAPSKQSSGRFYWYSMPYFTPTKEGKYLD